VETAVTLTEVVLFLIKKWVPILAPRQLHFGTVVSTSPLEVRLDQESASVPALMRGSAYTPSNLDRVLVVHAGNEICIIAKVVTA
jgi:hypothetical protein